MVWTLKKRYSRGVAPANYRIVHLVIFYWYWYCMVLYCTALYCIVSYGILCYFMVPNSIARYCMLLRRWLRHAGCVSQDAIYFILSLQLIKCMSKGSLLSNDWIHFLRERSRKVEDWSPDLLKTQRIQSLFFSSTWSLSQVGTLMPWNIFINAKTVSYVRNQLLLLHFVTILLSDSIDYKSFSCISKEVICDLTHGSISSSS